MVMKAMLLLFLFQSALASEVKILSWNVFMLPKPIKNSRQRERMVLIRDALLSQSHDVIVLQESFSDLFRQTISQGLSKKYPHQMILGKSTSIKKVMNSGIFILSRYPFKRLGYRYYTYCGSADCFAAKGVMLVEMALPGGKIIQLAGTHLQAGQSDSMKEVRIHQTDQVRELLDEHYKEGVPQIFAGDLNMDALHTTELSDLLVRGNFTNDQLSSGSLNASNSLQVSCFGQRENMRPSWLDHILTRAHGSSLVQKEKKIMRLMAKVNGQNCDLSDHLPVSGTFEIQ